MFRSAGLVLCAVSVLLALGDAASVEPTKMNIRKMNQDDDDDDGSATGSAKESTPSSSVEASGSDSESEPAAEAAAEAAEVCGYGNALTYEGVTHPAAPPNVIKACRCQTSGYDPTVEWWDQQKACAQVPRDGTGKLSEVDPANIGYAACTELLAIGCPDLVPANCKPRCSNEDFAGNMLASDINKNPKGQFCACEYTGPV